MKKSKKLLNLILISLLAVGAVVLVVWLASREGGYSEPRGTFHSPTLYAMDTTLDFTLQGRDGKLAKQDVDAAVALIHRIEAETSRFKSGSDVEKVNAQAGVAPVKVNDSTFDIIKTSLDYSKQSGGAFDITVAPLVKLWGFYDQKYRVPSPEEVAAARSLVDYRKVLLDENNKTVMLADKGMELDLGGVAKGYAVGEAYSLMKSRGVQHALINFGGAIGALGKRVDGSDWIIGIKDPRGQGGELLGELKVSDGFVSTSGDYERFFIKNGKRYFHIFDPATGYNPANAMSTTVVGPSGMLVDVLSKIIVMGPLRGIEFMKTHPEYQGLFIDGSGNITYTPQMKSKYVIEIKDKVGI
jgi:thiamine biosynthesis lipoprotein